MDSGLKNVLLLVLHWDTFKDDKSRSESGPFENKKESGM